MELPPFRSFPQKESQKLKRVDEPFLELTNMEERFQQTKEENNKTFA